MMFDKKIALGRVILSFLPLLTAVPVLSAESHDASSLEVAATSDVSCVPVAQRGNLETGCFVLAHKELGNLPATPLYWHLLVYPTHVAAERAKGDLGTVVDSFGKVWLLAVADASWSPAGGQHVSRIGPLPIAHAGSYTAEYMEATFLPGMKSRVHRHPGPEAWYVVSGEQCAETPEQKIVLRQGEGGLVPEGPPMVLWGTGTAQRRGLALILHDTSRPMTLPATDWKPAGLCEKELKREQRR